MNKFTGYSSNFVAHIMNSLICCVILICFTLVEGYVPPVNGIKKYQNKLKVFKIKNVPTIKFKTKLRLSMNSNNRQRYDPYETDPVLKSRVLEEILTMNNYSIEEIKKEIENNYNVSTKSIFDRTELEQKLAVLRIQKSIEIETNSNRNLQDKQERATLLLDEIARVETLTTSDIIEELNSRRVPFEKPIERDNIVRQLAVCRVDQIRVVTDNNKNNNNKNNNNINNNDGRGAEGNNGVWRNVKRTVKDFSSRMMYTDSEKEARDVVDMTSYSNNNNNNSNNNNNGGTKDDIKFTNNDNDSKVGVVYPEDFIDFDSARNWALNAPYTLVVETCSRYGVAIPVGTSTDEIADVFANCMMTIRISSVSHSKYNEDFSGSSTSSSSNDNSRTIWNNRRSSSDIPNPELIFIDQFINAVKKINTSIGKSIQQWNHDVFQTDSVTQTLSSLSQASFVHAFINFMASVLLAGSEITLSLGMWASGVTNENETEIQDTNNDSHNKGTHSNGNSDGTTRRNYAPGGSRVARPGVSSVSDMTNPSSSIPSPTAATSTSYYAYTSRVTRAVKPIVSQTLFGVTFLCLLLRRGLPTWVGLLVSWRFVRMNVLAPAPIAAPSQTS